LGAKVRTGGKNVHAWKRAGGGQEKRHSSKEGREVEGENRKGWTG